MSERQCIYCLERKSLTEFNTEHVIQRSMTPKIQNNLTLVERVCKQCNKYFDTNLDRPLAKDSIYGLDRIQKGYTSVGKIHQYLGRRVTMQTNSDDTNLNGAPVGVSERYGELAYVLKPHIVIEKKVGSPIRLFAEDLAELPKDFDLSELTGRIKFWADTEEEEAVIWELSQAAFTRLGHPLEKMGTYIPGIVPVFAEVEFGITEYRTFAKIAFNYMAKMTDHIPSFVLQECFGTVRNFVRYGEEPDYKVVKSIGNVGRYGVLGIEEQLHGHFVDLRLHRDGIRYEVTARLTLFNRFGWNVLLCPDYRGLHYDIDRMHHWNFDALICEPFNGGKPATQK